MILRNDSLVARLDSDYQKMRDKGFALESAISMYQSLSGLRGLWCTGAVGASGQAQDMSSLDLHLTNSSVKYSAYRGIPIANIDSASSARLTRASEAAFQISGSETYFETASRGMTIGAWVNAQSTGINQTLMGKWQNSPAAMRQYILYAGTGNTWSFIVSSDGTAQTTKTHSTVFVTNRWYFVVGRFDPSTHVGIWVNDVYEENTTSIPSSLYVAGTEEFNFGRYNGSGTPQAYLDAYVSFGFLCSSALPDSTIRMLYYRTRPMFQDLSGV